MEMSEIADRMQDVLRKAGREEPPTFLDALTFYHDNHPSGNVWGNLHIALADGNLEDGHIWKCQEFCEQAQDWLGLWIATEMRGMSMKTRQSLYESAREAFDG